MESQSRLSSPSHHIEAAATFVRQRWPSRPRAHVILGTGLGRLAEAVEARVALPFDEIPRLAPSTVSGHLGRLVCGRLDGVDVIVQQGRLHLYEGHSPQLAALPIRVACALGAETLIVTNAAGGLNPRFSVGDLMLIDDHVNLMFDNPLVGPNDDGLGPRFPDMSAPYDRELQDAALRVATGQGTTVARGVYVGVLGPNYETRAEYRMCRKLGGDAVGMSTVPEVLAARHGGMRVLGVSTITNVGAPDAPKKTTGHDVLANASAVAAKVESIIRGVIGLLRA